MIWPDYAILATILISILVGLLRGFIKEVLSLLIWAVAFFVAYHYGGNLAVLMENSGRVVSQRDLLEQVWGREYIDDVYYPRVYISQLRRKIEPDAANPIYILTEHRVGYRFEKQIRSFS